MVSVPAPMLAVEGQPPDTAGWAIEMKWDGARAIALCESGQCRLYNRNRHDVTDSYPELAFALATLSGSRQLVVDGEIVAQTTSGTPSSGLLQARMHVTRPTNELIRTVPVQLYLFDLLSANGESTMAMPYLARRRRLDDLELSGPLVTVPPFWVDLEAARLMAMAREHHREGIISKQTTSIYQSGRRSPAWIKSLFWKTTEAVIAGWMPGTRMTAATFGSLVLGAYDNAGRLIYIGNVGTGFTMATRRQLRTELDSLTQPNSPFDIQPPPAGIGAAHWVRPRLVGDVEYREFTGDGLRHPSWRGLRTDKDPEQIRLPL
ncbi:non-homologous end-joining DNA ligase [Nocardia sp. CWNU-33]|uniref:non-homologous end-joining DNA ligase n=1 Tax=Nocardia sp. CWNU-33 TaxID=3392117 RepID=UPI00398E4E97